MQTMMAERHTVDFKRCSFNVVTDHERRSITLQFERSGDGRETASPMILKSLNFSYGNGLLARWLRLGMRTANPFVSMSGVRAHPENPDVHCIEMAVKRGEQMEAALAALLKFLRQQPGYLRTYGAPLDRNEVASAGGNAKAGDVSSAASDVLIMLLNLRRSKSRRG